MRTICKMGCLAMMMTMLLFSSCSKSKDEPTNPSKEQTEDQGLRCVLEVWTDSPAEISFWGVSYRGSLWQDGKKISDNGFITLLKDLGTFPIESKHYKTEFICSKQQLLTINFWIRRAKNDNTLDPLGYRYKAQFYVGDKLVKEQKEDNGMAGIIGQGNQVYFP